MNKNKEIISKFKDFFVNNYKDEIFEILEKYSRERSLIIKYDELESFDSYLADLLYKKPEEIINAAGLAIKNIDPLTKDANINIRFINFSNGSGLTEVNSFNIGKLMSIDGIIENVEDVNPILKTAVFECRGCMRLHEVEQYSITKMIEPSLCSECGSRSFGLLQDESSYVDSQLLIVGHNETNQKIKLVLRDDLCSYDDFYSGLGIFATGILKTFKNSKGIFEKYILVNNLELLEKEDLISDELYVDLDDDESRRGSSEYNKWVKKVISNSSNVCQCCGGDKHLAAHHIFSYKNHPEYRLNPDNGVALCKWCHGKYHSYYGKEANPRTLIEFLNRFGNSKKEIISLNHSNETPNLVKSLFGSSSKQTNDEKKKFEVSKSFINLIKSMENDERGCSIELLKVKLQSKGINEETINHNIKYGLQYGLIYKPCEGFLKVVL